MSDEEAKRFHSTASNPGRVYDGRQSMEQHPTVPLMAAGAMPHNGHGHGHAPSLSQHPALRDGHRDHHLGRDAALVGAGGLAAHEIGKNHGHRHHGSVNTTAGLPPSTPHTSRYLNDTEVAGAGGLTGHSKYSEPLASNKAPHTGNHHIGRDALVGAGGLAAYEAGKHHQGHHDYGNAKAHDSAISSGTGVGGISNGVNHHQQRHHRDPAFEPTTTTGGFKSDNHHLERDAGLASVGLLAGAKHHHDRKPITTTHDLNNAEPHEGTHHLGRNMGVNGTQTTGHQAPPSYSGEFGSQPEHHYGRDAGLAGAGGLAAYEVGKHHQKKRDSNIENPFVPRPPSPRRSTPSSRAGPTEAMASGALPETGLLRDESPPRSAGLPKRNDRDRPPTPFGLGGVGQPYDDMHVHQLVSEPPSQELQQAPRNHNVTFAPEVDGHYPEENRRSRGYSTPPEVPSRSPNRASRNPAQLVTDSSYDSSLSSNTRDSSSGAEQYHRHPDPYAPAVHESSPMAPPAIPWSDDEYVHQQRRHSHSPRQSMQYDGRRKSRSPATSINGQPRRLRFEDLQANGEVPPTPTTGQYMHGGYAPVGGHDSYDGLEHQRWSQGVGEAM